MVVTRNIDVLVLFRFNKDFTYNSQMQNNGLFSLIPSQQHPGPPIQTHQTVYAHPNQNLQNQSQNFSNH